MDKRFDAVDKRFESMQQTMDSRFDSILEAMNSRFEAMQQAADKRFEASDKRFDELTRRLDRFMLWSFSLTVSVGVLVVAAIKMWP